MAQALLQFSLVVQDSPFFTSTRPLPPHRKGRAWVGVSTCPTYVLGQTRKEGTMKAYAQTKENVSGFSLMELMATISVIGILAAIAIPAFSSWLPDYRLKTAARDLYSNLQRAKMGAIKSNSQWRVYFDVNGGSPGRYFLLSGDGGDGWDTPTTLGGNDVVEMTINLSDYEGVDYGNGDATNQIDGDAFGSAIDYNGNPPNPPATNFTPRGTVDLRGHVYLSNAKGTCYGVGTPSPAGVIVLRRFNSSGWQ